MIEKPVVGLAICGGLFTFCTVLNVATVMQAVGAIAAGSTAVIIFVHTVRVKYRQWKNKSLS